VTARQEKQRVGWKDRNVSSIDSGIKDLSTLTLFIQSIMAITGTMAADGEPMMLMC